MQTKLTFNKPKIVRRGGVCFVILFAKTHFACILLVLPAFFLNLYQGSTFKTTAVNVLTMIYLTLQYFDMCTKFLILCFETSVKTYKFMNALGYFCGDH